MIIWVLIFSLLLRLINLNQSLWLDEVFMVKSTQFYSLSGLLTQYLPFDFNPPLSYLVTFSFSRLFGYSEIALRLPSVIMAVLTIWFVYQLAQLIFSQKTALFSSLLLATSGLHIYYSQEARMYSLVTLGVVGSFWALLSFLKTKKNLPWYVFFLILTLYSHYLGWFILPAQLFFIFSQKRSKLKPILLAQVLAFIATLPWLPILFKQIRTGLLVTASNSPWNQVVGGVSLKSLSLIPVKFLIGRISIDNNMLFAGILLLPLLLVSWLLLLFIKNFKKNLFAFKLIASWLTVPFALIFLVSLKVPVLAYFRLLFLLPAFYLSLTFAVSQLSNKLKPLVALTLIAINLVTSGIYLFNPHFHREDWRQLVKVLKQKNFTDSPVVIIPAIDAPLKYYYSQDNIISTDNLDSVLDQSEIWLVPYAQEIFDPQNATSNQITKSGFQPNFKQHFRGDLTLIQYTK